jgi:hypothetical protein
MKLTQYFSRVRANGEEKIHSNAPDEVPPAPGTVPIPPGNVRLYHYINLRTGQTEEQALESVRQTGIDISKSRGHTYAEPNVVWASTQIPNRGKIFLEFFMPADDARWLIGRPRTPEDVDWLHKSGADVTFRDSIGPDEIIAIHLPWHETYRYLKENDITPRVLEGEFDNLLDKPESKEARAIQYIKDKFGGGIS